MSRRRLPDRLVALMNGHRIGVVEREGSRLRFVYDGGWVQHGPGFPISLSMPMTERSHGHDKIYPWLWNLLPDNERTLTLMAAQHDVSAKNPFALLWKTGEDCPGAIQFVEEGRVDHLKLGGEIEWLTDEQIGERLRRLKVEASTGRREGEGQFSLPGAQPKTALCRIDGRWGIPSGRVPTTHILKPPTITDIDGHAHNEHFCLALARKVEINAARSEIGVFGGEIAIVVERFDRVKLPTGAYTRVHQEDLCQSLGVHPALKYEPDGGPSIGTIMGLLKLSSKASLDRQRFIQAIAFNFLIAGTDAHAKNYSMLFGRNQARLAPLYDLASYLPYFEPLGKRWQDVRMPMKIGDNYLYDAVYPRHWERMASAAGYPAREALDHVTTLAAALPAAAEEIAAEMRAHGLDHPVLDRLVSGIVSRCQSVTRAGAT